MVSLEKNEAVVCDPSGQLLCVTNKKVIWIVFVQSRIRLEGCVQSWIVVRLKRAHLDIFWRRNGPPLKIEADTTLTT